MKRLSLLGFVGLLASILAGCPIFPSEGSSDGCGPGGIDCSSSGNPSGCQGPADCPGNETCGKDNQCHSGDCTSWGCNLGFECDIDPTTQTASCQPVGGQGGSGAGTSSGGSGQGGSGTSSGGGGAGGGTGVIYCGNPKDCSAEQTCSPDGTCHAGDCQVNGCIYGYACGVNGACTHTNPAACSGDGECAALGAGYACVSGICTQPADQCFDQTQCAAGDKCVAGKCTPGCVVSADCPVGSGYACDGGLGICSKPVKGCNITNDCGGPAKVCVAGACVPRSSGATCSPGDVWVDNGCIPTQSPSFICAVDGAQDACKTGSICLHHSCYISCQADPMTCTNLPQFNQCKTVTTTSGDHNVCGSKDNLGNECDPTNIQKVCVVGKICIDGSCK